MQSIIISTVLTNYDQVSSHCFNPNYKVSFVNIPFHGTSIVSTTFSICKSLILKTGSHTGPSSWPDACKYHRPCNGKPRNVTRIGGRCRSEVLRECTLYEKVSKAKACRRKDATRDGQKAQKDYIISRLASISTHTIYKCTAWRTSFHQVITTSLSTLYIHRPAYRAVVGIVV